MAGGAGFIKDSINSLDRNRALLKKRRMQKDNPYMYRTPRYGKPDYKELKAWRLLRIQASKMTRYKVWLITLALTGLVIFLVSTYLL